MADKRPPTIDEILGKSQAASLSVVTSVPAPPTKLVEPVREFLANVKPPVWTVDGVLQQGHVCAVTAVTNHGKTAVGLYLAVCVATGTAFAGRAVRHGAVLVLCGEDPDGFGIRLHATMAALKVDFADGCENIFVLPMSLPLSVHVDQIVAESTAFGVQFSLVIIDTSVTYFSGDDENDNAAMLNHALDMRELTRLPGRPTVLANCHPTGSATHENLRPRGGSAFMNEIDCNYTVWAENETATLHWQGKKRGPDFDPIPFEFVSHMVEFYGSQVPTVVAWPIDEARETALKQKRRENENRVLYAMLQNPNASISTWCSDCGWDDKKHKSRVHRILHKLKEYKFVEWKRGEWTLTNDGRKEAEKSR